MLCGKPKMGKSWLVLGFALGIACGGYVLSKVKVEPGHVLYLALEDNERRLQRRAKQVLHELHMTPEVLYLAVSWPRRSRASMRVARLATPNPKRPANRLWYPPPVVPPPEPPEPLASSRKLSWPLQSPG